MMFGRRKTDVPTAKKGTEDAVFKRQERLICANEIRKRAAKALSEAGKEIKEAFCEEADRIIEKYDRALKTALKGAQCRETNVSRTYIIGRTPELLKKFQKISRKYGIINISVKPVMDKIYVDFEIRDA